MIATRRNRLKPARLGPPPVVVPSHLFCAMLSTLRMLARTANADPETMRSVRRVARSQGAALRTRDVSRLREPPENSSTIPSPESARPLSRLPRVPTT